MHVNQYEEKAVIFTFISLKQNLNIVWAEVVAVPGLSLGLVGIIAGKGLVTFVHKQQKKSDDSLF